MVETSQQGFYRLTNLPPKEANPEETATFRHNYWASKIVA